MRYSIVVNTGRLQLASLNTTKSSRITWMRLHFRARGHALSNDSLTDTHEKRERERKRERDIEPFQKHSGCCEKQGEEQK